MQTLKRWWARLQTTHAWQAWKRYGDHRGNVLAGGVGYFAFFSIFPAVALAFTICGIVLRDRPELLTEVRQYVDQTLPGFVKNERTGKGVIPITIPQKNALTITGIIGVGGLVLAGLGWLGALRDGIRAIFDAPGQPGNAVMLKLRDLGVMLVLGIGVVVSAAVTVAAGGVAAKVAELVGLGSQSWVVGVVGFVIGVVLDTGLMALMLRVLSGVPMPWTALRAGSVFGGVALTVLKVGGSRLVAGTTGNPLFASIAVVVGLLVWLNLISRVMLVAAAWAANDADAQAAGRITEAQKDKLVEGPAPEPLDSIRDRTDAGLPTFGQRAADRTSVAAGAVLGAVGAVAVGSLAGGLRRLVRRG
ncbi:YihY/virulence factor BrkB family protein [Pedococcus ginsenosidimutans]|uniref:YihY/virulence factor BrkB family protein n=1 Tax=Pedococcus ginsenosidimutans TaxID=490570 RepID=A0ABP8YCP9_9MICO